MAKIKQVMHKGELLKPLREASIKFWEEQSVRSAIEVAQVISSWGDDVLDIFKIECETKQLTYECSKGCSYCCYQNVRINIFEAIAILDWIQLNLGDKGKFELLQRAETIYASSFGDGGDSKRWSRRQACPCLDLKTNECMIYPVRPVECRIALTYEKSLCKSSYEDASSLEISIRESGTLDIPLPTLNGIEVASVSEYVTECLLHPSLPRWSSKFYVNGKLKDFAPKNNDDLAVPFDLELSRVINFGLNNNSTTSINSLVNFDLDALLTCCKQTDANL